MRWPTLCVLALLLLCRPGATQSDEDVASQVMEDLKAADRARMQRVRELEDWQMEKQRLQLLRDALEEQTGDLEQRTEQVRAEVARLRERRARIAEARARHKALMQALEALAEKLNRALARIDRDGPPGLVPREAAELPVAADARVELSNALTRLRQARTRLETVDVEMADGRLNGEPRTVHCLRAGGVAAWWMTLDGKQVGIVRSDPAGTVLEPANSEDVAAEIRRAFKIAWGQEVPVWVTLPVGEAE
jgi:hypothetical protein